MAPGAGLEVSAEPLHGSQSQYQPQEPAGPSTATQMGPLGAGPTLTPGMVIAGPNTPGCAYMGTGTSPASVKQENSPQVVVQPGPEPALAAQLAVGTMGPAGTNSPLLLGCEQKLSAEGFLPGLPVPPDERAHPGAMLGSSSGEGGSGAGRGRAATRPHTPPRQSRSHDSAAKVRECGQQACLKLLPLRGCAWSVEGLVQTRASSNRAVLPALRP